MTVQLPSDIDQEHQEPIQLDPLPYGLVECESYLLMSSSRRIGQPPGQVHHNRVQWPPGSAVMQ